MPRSSARDRRVLPDAPRGPRGRPDRRHHLRLPGQARSTRRAAARLRRRRGRRRAVDRRRASLVVLTVGRLPLVVQETIEGVAAVFAVIVLTWMLFWMRRQGRAMKGDLERGVDEALASRIDDRAHLAGLRGGHPRGPRDGPVPVRHRLVGRRHRPAARSPSAGRVWPSRSRIGYGDLRRSASASTCVASSRSPGVVLIFVSAGLVAFAIGEFTEAGLLPATPVVFDLGAVLPGVEPARLGPGRAVRLPLGADRPRARRLPRLPRSRCSSCSSAERPPRVAPDAGRPAPEPTRAVTLRTAGARPSPG